MLSLTSAELARVRRASEILLAPLDHAHVDDWRRAVNRELRELVDADSAGFLLPVAEATPMYSEEHSAEVLAPFPGLLPPPLADGSSAWERLVSLGAATLGQVYGESSPTYHASAYYNDYAAKGGGAETIALAMTTAGTVTSPAGAASVHLWHSRLGKRRFGEREVAILSLLFPAFQAGIKSWMQFSAQRTGLLTTIDLLSQAVAVCDERGTLVHLSAALMRMLGAEPDESALRAAMSRLALRASSRPAGDDTHHFTGGMHTRRGHYAMHCCLYHGAGAGAPLVLVSLQQSTTSQRSGDDLRMLYGLTPAECRVAHLLAAGSSNAELAVALGISTHTAKRHVERVLLKLDVRSRAMVAATIRR